MGIYLRNNWKIKPERAQLGSDADIQSSIFKNAESIGINPTQLDLYFPLWERVGSPINYIKADSAELINGASWQNSDIKTVYTSTQYIRYSSSEIGTDDSPFTYSVLLELPALRDYNAGITQTNGSYPAPIDMYVTSSGALTGIIGNGQSGGGTNYQIISSSENLVANKEYLITITYNGTTGKLYLNNKLVGSTSKPLAGCDNLNTYMMMGNRGDNVTASTAFFKTALAVRTELSLSQIAYLSDNPYFLLQRVTPVIYSVPSGGGITITLSDLAQSHVITAPELTQKNTLSASDLAQAQVLSASTLTQKNIITLADLAQAQTLGVPTLVQASALIVNGLNQAHSLTALELIQKHSLLIASLVQAQATENISLTLAQLLEIVSLLQAQDVTGVDLIQKSNLNLDSLTQAQSATALELIQKHNLIVQGLAQAQTIDNLSLSLAGVLQVASLIQSQGLTAATLSQAYNLAINNLTHAQSLGSVELALAYLLEVAGLSQAHSLGALNLSTVTVLTVDNLGQSQSLGSMTLSQAHDLVINDLSHNQSLSAVSFATIRGKVTITFGIKTPGLTFGIKTPGLTFGIKCPTATFTME